MIVPHLRRAMPLGTFVVSADVSAAAPPTGRTAVQRIRTRVCVSLSAVVIALCSTASAAGDASRGSVLYRVTYGCTECHASNPTPFTVPPAPTVDALLAAIQMPPMRSRYLSTLAQNATDLADIAAYIASILGVETGPDIDQQGLTGSWYEAASSGQGIEVEVFPDLVGAGVGLVGGAWFTFDAAPAGGADRQRWYTFSGNGPTGQSSANVTIFENVGGNFNAPPVTSAAMVGSGTLTFSDCTNGRFDYTFVDGSNRSGSIPLTRITPNVACASGTAPVTNADFGLSGNWFDAAISGQGFLFEVNPLAPVVFFAWYTYSPNGQAAGASGQRWFTGQGRFTAGTHTAQLVLFETTGGVFDTPTPMTQATVPVGTATITFASCTSARLTFNFAGGSSAGQAGTIDLTRVGPVPAGCAVSADVRR